MNWPTATTIIFVLLCCTVSCTSMVRSEYDAKAAIASACVSSGGQWRNPNWYQPPGCIR